MNKKIEKEFWVSDECMEMISRGTYFTAYKSRAYGNRIIISWEEPEKKITISESEFDLIVLSAKNNIHDGRDLSISERIKLGLFGGGE